MDRVDEPAEEPVEETHDEPPRAPLLPALGIAALATVTTGAVITYAFEPARAGQSSILASMGALYAVLGAFALVRLYRRGELLQRFRPASGDITLGAAIAGALYGAARIVELLVATHGSVRELWLIGLYHQIDGPDGTPDRMTLGLLVFVVAALEELVWRGLVMLSLEAAIGGLRACVLSTVLFGLAHISTMFLLSAPIAGPNPLVLVAALGCGLVWSLLVFRTGRLVPALIAHALFSWSIIEFPLWRP